MTEEDDVAYYRGMFKSSLLWSVIIVALFGLIAWIV